MKLVYVYHSCFAILADGYSLLIDYYRDTTEHPGKGFVHEELLSREGPLYVLASHSHADHFSKEVFEWKDVKKDIYYVLSDDIRKRFKLPADSANFLKKGDVFEDKNIKAEAFGSTDRGISFLLTLDGNQVFHAGDLNDWHWKDESTLEEVKSAEGSYKKELSDIKKRTEHVRLAMFPVDPRLGTDFDEGAKLFVDNIRTEIFVPMHYWQFAELASSFGSYAEDKGARFEMMRRPGESIIF
jgi:L-ascorbate metabolism protein UlaG (beta-lactamase superfamily)